MKFRVVHKHKLTPLAASPARPCPRSLTALKDDEDFVLAAIRAVRARDNTEVLILILIYQRCFYILVNGSKFRSSFLIRSTSSTFISTATHRPSLHTTHRHQACDFEPSKVPIVSRDESLYDYSEHRGSAIDSYPPVEIILHYGELPLDHVCFDLLEFSLIRTACTTCGGEPSVPAFNTIDVHTRRSCTTFTTHNHARASTGTRMPP